MSPRRDLRSRYLPPQPDVRLPCRGGCKSPYRSRRGRAGHASVAYLWALPLSQSIKCVGSADGARRSLILPHSSPIVTENAADGGQQVNVPKKEKQKKATASARRLKAV